MAHDRREWYTANQAARAVGLSIAMVNYLSRQHVVEPSCSCKRGHGSARHYSFADVLALKLVAKLSKAGVSVSRLKKALRRLQLMEPKISLRSLPATHVITDGRELYLRRRGESFERAVDGQLAFAFIVDLCPMHKALARKLEGVRGTPAKVA